MNLRQDRQFETEIRVSLAANGRLCTEGDAALFDGALGERVPLVVAGFGMDAPI